LTELELDLQSKVTLKRLLLAGVLGRHNLDLTRLEPDIETGTHAASNIGEGHTLIDAVFEE